MIFNTIKSACITVLALFFIAPILVVFAVSVNEKKSLSFPPQGFSLAWYQEIFSDTAWFNALVNSLLIAGIVAAVSVMIAAPVAWFLWQYKVRWVRFVLVLGVAPFMLPPVITALGALSFWATSGFYGQSWTVVLSHGIFFVSLPLVTVSIGFANVNRELVEAAISMGATTKQVALTVILPLIKPYLISGFAFAFVLSLNEYIVAYMTIGFSFETIPIKIFNALRYGYTPTMASISALFVVIAVVVFGVIARFGDLPKLLGAWEED